MKFRTVVSSARWVHVTKPNGYRLIESPPPAFQVCQVAPPHRVPPICHSLQDNVDFVYGSDGSTYRATVTSFMTTTEILGSATATSSIGQKVGSFTYCN